MNILFITFGDQNCPSTRYRVVQYLDFFKKNGHHTTCIEAKDFIAHKLDAQFDTIVIQKSILPLTKIRAIKKATGFLVYDCDDAIWTRPKRKYRFLTRIRIYIRMKYLMRSIDVATCANGVIRDGLVNFGGKNIYIVPMALTNSSTKHKTTESDKIIIGWSGAPHNLNLLEKILPALKVIEKEFGHRVSFHIHSGVDPGIIGLKYEYIPYSPTNADRICSTFDIGLTPLVNDYFNNAKSPIKSLLYMRDGCAVIASPYGAINEIVKHEINGLLADQPDEWTTSIRRLITNNELRTRLANNGKDFQETNHSVGVVGERFLRIIVNRRSA